MVTPVAPDNARTDQLASSGRDGEMAAQERQRGGAQ
jgi:hypothetical protein